MPARPAATDLCPNCFAGPVSDSVDAHCRYCGFSYREAFRERQFLAPHSLLDQGRYQIGRILGEPGSYGVVYAALDRSQGRQVAIKEFFPSGSLARRAEDGMRVLAVQGRRRDYDEWLRRFLNEALLLARFGHCRHIVDVVEVLPTNGTAYIVMERLDGQNLSTRLGVRTTAAGVRCRHPLPLDQARVLLDRLLDAVEPLHRTQPLAVIHRDISPNNLFLPDGRIERLKLLDFGLARAGTSPLPAASAGLGTPGFAAPEQLQTSAAPPVGPYSDLYSVGAVVYLALTGAAPPGALERMAGTPLARVGARCPEIPPEFGAVVDACLQLNVDRRPTSVDQIRACLSGGTLRARPLAGAAEPSAYPGGGPRIDLVGGNGRPVPNPSGVDRNIGHAGPPSRRWPWWTSGLLLASAGLLVGQPWWTTGLVDLAGPSYLPGQTELSDNRPTPAAPPAPQSEAEPEPQPEPEAEPKPKPMSAEQCRNAQRALNALGFAVGPADGICGSQTRQGIKTWQTDHGLAPDGLLTPAGLATLSAEAARLPPPTVVVQPPHADKPALRTPAPVDGPVDEPVATAVDPVDADPPSAATTAVEPIAPRAAPPVSPADWDYPMIRVAAARLPSGRRVEAFLLGKYEVSAAQWQQVMGELPGDYRGCPKCPITRVSWDQARAFIERLRDRTGAAYRLPSEAEWELACRAGTPDRYCGGDRADRVGWFFFNGERRLKPVGTLAANALGFYDMSGNAAEWTADCWAASDAQKRAEPGTFGGCDRAVRGGSVGFTSQAATADKRMAGESHQSYPFVGLRLARDRPVSARDD